MNVERSISRMRAAALSARLAGDVTLAECLEQHAKQMEVDSVRHSERISGAAKLGGRLVASADRGSGR